MPGLPTGTLTFLFTDIEGSTALWERSPIEMGIAVAHHDVLLRTNIESYSGIIFKTVGDAFYAVFTSAGKALSAAVATQLALATETWSANIGSLHVRMALYTGEAEHRGEDYFGQPLNRVARILAVGHGGQVLLSQATQSLIRDMLPQEVTLRDLGEHRLKDIQYPERIFQLEIATLPSDFPPLKTLDCHPNNLPTQLTPFVGREQDLVALNALLLKELVRLVTLTGPGGTGKTRLALQVAASLADHFPCGVFFVELAAITDADAVMQVAAQALELHEAGNQLLLESIKKRLDSKVLLIFDNFEHVLDAASQVQDLLLSCPLLKVIVTSRATLHLQGEYEYPVSPLPVPDSKLPFDPVCWSRFGAIELFVQQAKAVKPDFKLNSANAAAVANICVRLDGLPLAIELAAARINLLPPQAMLKRLGNRLQLLTGKVKNRSVRQQTLRGTIAWSYELLDDSEKSMFRRLAVFINGCTLEAVEQVCLIENSLNFDVLDIVRSLLDKSLLRPRELECEEPRFAMLDTIREYALEQLAAIGERETFQQRHAAYYLELAELAAPALTGVEQKRWLTILDKEHDNLLAALEWWAICGQPDIGLHLAASLWRFWWIRGYLDEGRKWLEKLLASTSHTTVATTVRAKALEGASALACSQNDYQRSISLAEEALALSQQIDDRETMSGAYTLLAEVAIAQGDSQRATVLYEESLCLRRALDDKRGIAGLLNNLGNIALRLGKLDHAAMSYEECLALFHEVEDEWAIAAVLNNLGEVERYRRNYERAAILYEESLKLRRVLGYSWGIAASLVNLGDIARYQANHQQAVKLYKESLSLFRAMGDNVGITVCLEGLAEAAFALNLLERSIRLFAQAQLVRHTLGATGLQYDSAAHDSTIATLRTALGPDFFDVLWTTGRTLMLSQVIDEALTLSM